MEDKHKLLIESVQLGAESQKSDYFCENFRIFPTEKESLGGYMFGIIELNATPYDEASKIYQTIFNTLKDSYYQQVLNSPAPEKLNTETIFEFALDKTNSRLIELIEIGQIKLILENLHYFIGIARPLPLPHDNNCELVFTNKGAINAHLVHEVSKQNFKIINVLGDSQVSAPNHSDKIKIFSALTCGQISLHDSFLISTEIVNNFLSAPKILHILSNQPLTKALDFFKMQIKTLRNETSPTYSILLLNFDENHDLSNQPISHKSIDHLINTAEKTEKLLAPNISLNIKKNIKNSLGFIIRFFTIKRPDGSSHWKMIIQTIKQIFLSFFGIFVQIKRFFVSFYQIITGKKKLSFSEIINSIKRTILALRQENNKRKVWSAIIVVLILTLSIGVFGIRQQRARAESQRQYAAAITKIKTLVSDAEANFIINNKSRSLSQINDALTELDYLPQATDIQKINHQDLQKTVGDWRNKILGIEKVVPQLVAELDFGGELSTPAQIQSFTNTNIIASGNQTLFTININNKTVDQKIPIAAKVKLMSGQDNKVVFFDEFGQLWQLNGITPVKLPLQVTLPDVLGYYNDNLYTVSRDKNTITKYKIIDQTVSAGQSWVKDLQGETLSDTTSLTIDGNLFLSKRNGQIIKLFSGTKKDFNMTAIEPVATQATRLITTANYTSLYLLEAGSKRVIMLTKDGQIAKQLNFDSLPTTDDLAISPDEKTGFILSGNKVYQFPL